MKNFYILLHDGYVLYLSHFNDELQIFMYEHELLIYKLLSKWWQLQKEKFARVEI